MSLEVVVRPSQSPDIRPLTALGLGAPAAVDPENEVVWGDSGNSAFTFSKHYSVTIEAVHDEKERTYDQVRVKNPDDEDQHVDVEVLRKISTAKRKWIDEQEMTLNYKALDPDPDGLTEILSRNNKR